MESLLHNTRNIFLNVFYQPRDAGVLFSFKIIPSHFFKIIVSPPPSPEDRYVHFWGKKYEKGRIKTHLFMFSFFGSSFAPFPNLKNIHPC